jgi:AraC-like DNA-binding protein
MTVLQESDIYREWAPPPAWRGVVACCWEQHVTVERAHRVLPDGCADIVIHAAGETEVVGVSDEVSTPVLPAGASIRGVRIRPEAVAAMFAVDASTLRNRSVGLDDVLGAKHNRRIRDNAALDAWIRSVEPPARTAAAVQLLHHHRVAAVAEQIGMSVRQLHRTMLTHVGVSPKSYQRTLRLRDFLAHVERGDTLPAAAARAGYADQSHMTNEVGRLSGTTPTALLAERGLTS